MAGLMYIPQRQNQMFSVLSNLMFQKMAHKQRMEIADKQIAARTLADKQEVERAKLMLEEGRLHEEQQTEKANQRQDERDTKEARSKMLLAGYTPAAATATTTPVVAGMNVAPENSFFDPVTNQRWQKPVEDVKPEDSFVTLPKTIIGKQIVIPQKNERTGKITYEKFGEVNQKGGTDINPEKQQKAATTLRKEFVAGSKTYREVRDAFNRIEQAAAINPDDPQARGAGDLALIFNYMKVLDPGSVVRESEFATAETSKAKLEENGVPSFIITLREKIFKGGRLTPRQRKDFVSRARLLYKKQEQTHKKYSRQYDRLAKSYNVPRDNVIVDFLPDVEPVPIPKKLQPAHKVKEVDALYEKYPFLKGN